MIDRRVFVQRLSALALMPGVPRNQQLYTGCSLKSSVLKAAMERVRSGEIGELTHVFVYSYQERLSTRYGGESIAEMIARTRSQQLEVANAIFSEAPQNVFVGQGDSEGGIEAMFTYSGDRRFLFRAMTHRQEKIERVWFYGVRGSISVAL